MSENSGSVHLHDRLEQDLVNYTVSSVLLGVRLCAKVARSAVCNKTDSAPRFNSLVVHTTTYHYVRTKDGLQKTLNKHLFTYICHMTGAGLSSITTCIF